MECKNCELSIQTHHNFCPNCGAKIIRKRLTIKALFSHFSEQFLNYDNKLLQTFIDLFKKPEAVIGCYISGTRKKYVNVISFFAIAITIAGLQLYLLNKYFPELVNLSSITAKGQEELASRNLAFIQEYQSIMMIFYVPIYALISKIVFFNIKKYNYTEHLVIFMYILAHLSILGAILVILGAFFQLSLGTVSILTLPLQIFYSAYCLKRLYNLNIQGIILRTLLFILVLFVLLVIISIGYVVIMYFNGGLQEMIDTQNAVNSN